MLFIKFIVVFCLTKIEEVMEKKKKQIKRKQKNKKKTEDI